MYVRARVCVCVCVFCQQSIVAPVNKWACVTRAKPWTEGPLPAAFPANFTIPMTVASACVGSLLLLLTCTSPHLTSPHLTSPHLTAMQDSLSGDSKTLMLVNVNPTDSDAGETVCSLGFASRVRGVELGPAKKHIEAGAEVQELRGQLDALRQQVSHSHMLCSQVILLSWLLLISSRYSRPLQLCRIQNPNQGLHIAS